MRHDAAPQKNTGAESARRVGLLGAVAGAVTSWDPQKEWEIPTAYWSMSSPTLGACSALLL